MSGPTTQAFYLVTYAPLVCSKAGRAAVEQYGVPPFVDGSIRREPDLEHELPSISCLCHAGKFAPRLEVGDFVAYLTRKARYGLKERHRRLTALLQVVALFESHAAAADYYRECRRPLPQNCVVPGNLPLPLDHSHRRFDASGCASDSQTHRAWEAEYRARARKFPRFVVCEPMYQNLSWTAPVVGDAELQRVFGRIPGTQNPGAMTVDDLRKLVRVLRLPAPPLFQ